MTNVTLYQTSDGLLRGFECRGHAGYAPAGNDIVCAAVSVLSTTCANALETVAGVKPQLTVQDGFMKLSLSADCVGQHDAQVILRTFEQGIRDIALSYPKYIHITMR
jgi:uncharacterized protein